MDFPSLKNSDAATSRAIKISFPGTYLEASIESNIKSKHSLLDEIWGAKPPSSPTEVESFLSNRIFFKELKISQPALSESLKESKPHGIIINS